MICGNCADAGDMAKESERGDLKAVYQHSLRLKAMALHRQCKNLGCTCQHAPLKMKKPTR